MNDQRTLQRTLVLERMREGPATAMDIRINGKTTRYLASKDHGRVIRIEEDNIIRIIKWDGKNVFNRRNSDGNCSQPDIGGAVNHSMGTTEGEG